MHVYECTCVHVHMCEFLSAEDREVHGAPVLSLNPFRQDLPLNLELACFGVSGQQAPAVLPPISSLCSAGATGTDHCPSSQCVPGRGLSSGPHAGAASFLTHLAMAPASGHLFVVRSTCLYFFDIFQLYSQTGIYFFSYFFY